MIFSRNIIEQVFFLTNQKLEMIMPQILKQNAYQISENIRVETKFRFSEAKTDIIK